MSGKDRSPADTAERVRLQKALRESVILRELADILNSSLDLEPLLHALVKRTTELCEVERCAVWLLNEGLSHFHPTTYHVASSVLAEEIIQKAGAAWYRTSLSVDNPIAQRLVEAGGMLYIEDLRNEATLQTLAGTFQIYAVLLVALIREGQLVGFLSLDNPGQLGTFSPEQYQLGRAIGHQATIAISNARLYQHAQAQQMRAEHLIERARAIYQVAMAVNSGEDLPVVLRLATRHLVRVLDANSGLTLLLDADETTLRPVDKQDVGYTLPTASISLDTLPHFHTAIATGRPLLINAEQAQDEEITWLHQFNLKSLLVVPLMVGADEQGAHWDLPGEQKSIVPGRGEVELLSDAHCVGLIVVNYSRRRKPSSGQHAFAQDIAAQCGLAIEKARLLDATIQAEKRIHMALDTFLHTAEAVSYSTNIQVILHGVLEKTLAAFTCTRGTVHLFQPEEQRFELLLVRGFTSEEEARWLEEQQTWLNPANEQIFGFYQQVMNGHATLVNTEHRSGQPQIFEQTMVLAAPIIHHQHILGLLLLDRSRSAPQELPYQAICSFTSWDFTIVEGIAQLAGVAMEQVRWQQEAITARANEATMREADALKNELLAITAHEFRNPLAIIQGHSQSALRSLRKANTSKAALPPAFEERLVTIETQAKQLNNIVATFLDAASLNRGQISLQLATVDLEKIARQVIEDQANLVKDHELRYVASTAEAPYLIQGDQARLAQIMGNLVENAIKYSPLGGPVTITLSRTSPFIEVCIEDKGLGIPQEAQTHLFERFYRVPSIDSQARGVGLGLYIVAQLVQMHEGSIRVESSGILGEGSRFIFTLPSSDS